MLPPDVDFARLMDQLQHKDEDAFAFLMGCYEQDVCRTIAVDIRRCSLGRILDPADIWQAVGMRFFQKASGPIPISNDPEQLLHLLRAMARNELRDQLRWSRRIRRDQTRERIHDAQSLESIPDWHPSADELIESRDWIDHALHHLHPQERALVLGWAEGKHWQELTQGPLDTPEATRKRFERAMARLSHLFRNREISQQMTVPQSEIDSDSRLFTGHSSFTEYTQ